MTQTWLVQDYNLPLPEGEEGSGSNIITSGDMMLFTFTPTMKAQYFVTVSSILSMVLIPGMISTATNS